MIEVHELGFRYARAGAPALTGVSFKIEPGEIFGFLGPSGAGKSTTQKILTGLLHGYSGKVAIMGKDLAAWRSDYYEHIGVSFELPNHFQKLTALENLRYFAALYSRPTLAPQSVLEQVGLGSDANLQVSKFSKGMMIRLNLARAMIHQPDLLFLDEPTSGLDPVNARRIKDIIVQQKSTGKTIFLTTHNMAIAEELCDRVAFLVDGKIRLIETPRNLRLLYGSSDVAIEYESNDLPERRLFPLAGLGHNCDFLQIIRDHTVQTIHTQEATLEDIFIKVTGRSLQ